MRDIKTLRIMVKLKLNRQDLVNNKELDKNNISNYSLTNQYNFVYLLLDNQSF